jgi:hypothetical protein
MHAPFSQHPLYAWAKLHEQNTQKEFQKEKRGYEYRHQSRCVCFCNSISCSFVLLGLVFGLTLLV